MYFCNYSFSVSSLYKVGIFSYFINRLIVSLHCSPDCYLYCIFESNTFVKIFINIVYKLTIFPQCPAFWEYLLVLIITYIVCIYHNFD